MAILRIVFLRQRYQGAFLLLMVVVKILRWALVPVTYFTLAYD